MAHVEIRNPNNDHNPEHYATTTDRYETAGTSPRSDQEFETSAKAVSGVGLLEAVGGVAAVVLPILGLLGIVPLLLAGVTAIVIGAALIIEGLGVSTRARHLMRETGGGRRQKADIGGGVTADFLGGGAGVALGILALVGIVPEILLPVSAIVFGATLVFSSGVKAELANVSEHSTTARDAESSARGATKAATGIQVLAGIAAAVLGILVLVGFTGGAGGLSLTHIAFLCVGAALVLSGTALGARMLAAMR